MQSFTSLNTPETVEFEDLRNPGIITDVPRAFDAQFTETVGEFDVYREIDIIEIIRPELANLRYQIGLTTQVIGAIPVVDFGTLPSGVTLVSNANTYTISGIDTLAKWNAVKDPEIKINDFLGNFAYSVKIIFFNGTADEEIRWTVGTYVPLSIMSGQFTQSVNGTKVRTFNCVMNSTTTLNTDENRVIALSSFTASIQGNKVRTLNSGITSQATLSATGRIVELLNLTYTINNPESLPNTHNFGTVAINNSFALIGASGYDQTGSTNIGRAYLYNLTTGNLQQTFSPATTFESNLKFGTSVALSNSYAMIANNGTVNNTAKARIYNLSNGNLLHTLDTTQSQTETQVTLSDSYAIIAVPNISGGKVYVYDLINNANLLYIISTPNLSNNDFFGQSVSVYGNQLLVGSAFYQSDQYRGRAYVYDLPTGNLLNTITNPSPIAPNINDGFADSVSLFGNFAVVGAQFEESSLAGPFNTGRVYVYNATTGSLIRTINPPNSSTEANFGRRISADNNFVIVSTTASKYVYDLTSGTLVKTLSQTGSEVDISQDYAIIGSPDENSGSGRVYIYRTNVIG
jgi:hypothetical protein